MAATSAYDVLHGSTALFAEVVERASADRDYAEDQLPTIEFRLAEQRTVTAALRKHLTVAIEQQTRLEALARAMRTLALGTTPDEPGLRGHSIASAAIDVLRRLGREGDELHYRDWMALLSEAGHVVAGKDPEATFLTALTRHPGIERVGSRTGIYRIRREDT